MPVQDRPSAATMNDIAAHQYTFRADPSIPSPADGTTKREEGINGDEKSPNKGKAVNRVGRACNGCRKQKMRCEGAENPPCKRCRHANIPCQFEKPVREQQGPEADRIQKLESQVGSIQQTLADLVGALKGTNAIPAYSAPQLPSPSSQAANGHYESVPPQGGHPSPPNAATGSVSGTSQASGGSHTSPAQGYPSDRDIQAAHALALARGGPSTMYQPPQQQQQQPHQEQRSQSVASSHSNYLVQGDGSVSPQMRLPFSNERGYTGPQQPLPPQQPGIPVQPGNGHFDHVLPAMSYPSPTSAGPSKERLPPLTVHLEGITTGHVDLNGSGSQPPSALPRRLSDLTSSRRARAHQGPVNFSPDVDSMGPPSHYRPRSSHGMHSIVPSSNVTSAYSSDDEGELPNSGLTAPLEVLRSLAESQEEERERRKARAEAGGRSRATSSISGEFAEAEGSSRPSKRRKIEKRAARPHAHPDAIAKGILTEDEARGLFDTYYAGCSKFLPVFEPQNDNYDELHRRSPFSVNAICMVASAVQDGGHGQSERTKRLMEEVKSISSNTLWLPVARREVVQATIIVGGWSTNGWLLGGHAIRMALELGIHKAWPRLLKKIRSGKKLKNIVGSDEHDLVVCSRIWFTLFLFEHQISFGTGRPFMIKTDESVEDGAAILSHPLSLEDDMRLVSSVELMIIRERLHGRLSVDGPVTPDTFEIIRDAERQFSDWFQRWDSQFAIRYLDYAFYRHSLLVQRFLSELFHNAVGLRGIRDEDDVKSIPPEQRQLAMQSVKVAQSAMDICLRSISYKDGLKYAPDYTHVTATFAAAFLIRLARLFPQDSDLTAICMDVEELADILSKVPATRYALTLKRMLRIAQKRRVLPIPPPAQPPMEVDPAAAGAVADHPPPAEPGEGSWPNGAAVETHAAGGSQSLSPPDDLAIITGLPMIYPDPDFTEPALGGEHPLAALYMPAMHQPDQGGLFPPDTSFSAFLPQGFGYSAVTGNWNVDENGNPIAEIW